MLLEPPDLDFILKINIKFTQIQVPHNDTPPISTKKNPDTSKQLQMSQVQVHNHNQL